MVRASVAMAVYNGELFIHQQIDSILSMLSDDDELVISYDRSSDSTLDIINTYAKKDTRVKVVFDSGKSVESNFNNAVANCSGKYIFLSDQDDVWIDDKINIMTDYFEKHPKCVVLIADGYLTDKQLNRTGSIFETYSTSANPVRNFVKGSYLGCQMGFRASIKDKVWPVRTDPPLPHDLWLGVMGAKYGTIDLMNDKLILHRMHEANYTNTSKMNLIGVVKNRLLFLTELIRRG